MTSTAEPIADLLAARWSPRAFDPDKSVDRQLLIGLFEAARWAPSCFNEQPWRYLVFDKHSELTSWEKALHCLVEGNQRWANRAPILIAAISDNEFDKPARANRWANYDTGAASENLCLQAYSVGLVSHQMGGFDTDKLRQSFHIPSRFDPIAMLAVGHPGNPDILDERNRETEISPRQRRPMSEMVFENDWENPFLNSV